MSIFSSLTARSVVGLLLLTAPMSLPRTTWAQNGGQVPATLAPADQKSLETARAIARNEKACKSLLDWNETGISLDEMAAQLRTQLGEDAPSIEVRTSNPLRATFTLTQAPLATTLNSLARLANCRVWVFAKGIVLAPESALSAEEVAAIKQHEGGDWMQSSAVTGSSVGWNGRDTLNRAALLIIGSDVKKQRAAKGQTDPEPLPVPSTPTPQGTRPAVSRDTLWAPFELPFGELSPATQVVLQELLDTQIQLYGGAQAKDNPAPRLTPEIVVGFDDTQRGRLRLFVRGTSLPTWQTRWNLNI